MKQSRFLSSILLASVLLVTIGCSETTGPSTEAIEVQVPPQVLAPDPLLGGLLGGTLGLVSGTVGVVDNTLTTVVDIAGSLLGLLSCSPQDYERESRVIGRHGGTVRVGRHELVIPRGALKRDVRITAEQVRGDVNSVRFSPEGLKFEKPVKLTLNYSNCENNRKPKKVVYTDEQLKVLEILKSSDSRRSEEVTGEIDHFSRYVVAY